MKKYTLIYTDYSEITPVLNIAKFVFIDGKGNIIQNFVTTQKGIDARTKVINAVSKLCFNDDSTGIDYTRHQPHPINSWITECEIVKL